MDKTDIVHALNQYVEKLNIYTITNRRVSLSKICHGWPNNAVTHECAHESLNIARVKLKTIISLWNYRFYLIRNIL
jgi:hypothetical protein